MMFKKSVLCLLLCALPFVGITGCASKYGEQTTKVERYPACYQPIAQLRDDETRVAKTTAASAAGGALLGAAIGFLATGKPSGAIAGAIAGGVTGGALGYTQSKQSQIKDQNSRMVSYIKDLDGDISGLDIVAASARTSIQCYDKEFTFLLASYKSGNITKFELENSYGEIRNGISEAERILGVASQKAQQRASEYHQAVNSEATQMGVPVPQAKPEEKKKKKVEKKQVEKKQTTASYDTPLHEMQAKTTVYVEKADEINALSEEARAMRTRMDNNLAMALG